MKEASNWISKINYIKFSKKSVLIIGGGGIVKDYVKALKLMKIDDITVIAKTGKTVKNLRIQNDVNLIIGGFESNLQKMTQKDLVIIALPITLLSNATNLAIKYGQKNILIEKPGALFSKYLEKINCKNQKIRIAYNRLVYPSFQKLLQLSKKEGITSCKFTFTEWVDKIDFKKGEKEVFSRWGISNSLHVISMAFEIIGLPKEMASFRKSKFDWHPNGTTFVGSGISKRGIPFSYHADWKSSGRWGIEIMTEKNAYRLIPLENLQVCKKNSTEWKSVSFKIAFPEIKAGIAEELAIMLNDKKNNKIDLTTLKTGITYIKIAEKIFGYTSKN